MNYERERLLAEQQAKHALGQGEWPMVAYNLFRAGRMALRLAEGASGRTRDSLARLAESYQERGEQALVKARAGGSGRDFANGTVKTNEEGAEQRQWLMSERPSVKLDDVAGMDEMKRVIEEHIILPTKHADIYAQYRLRPGAGVLMYGPPGTGKTYIAKAIAGELDAAFIPVKMDRVLSKWFGETEQLLAQMFDEARKYPRTVLFFDEAEALFAKRGSTNSSVMARVVPQLLQLINGVDAVKNTIILLGATNRPWLMDEAATRPERFGRLVYVGPPDTPARAAMLERSLRDTPHEGIDFDSLAQQTGGYSGADLVGERNSLTTEARLQAIRRTVSKAENKGGDGAEPVTMADFAEAMKLVRPSIRDTDLERFARFRASVT